MGIDDKVDNKPEELGGKAKEGIGTAIDDEQLELDIRSDHFPR
jgi:uncharacterized protein YjbJ (UPF0337 family)